MKDKKTLFILFLVFIYILLFCIYPIGKLLIDTFFPKNGDFINIFLNVIQEKSVKKAIYNTLEAGIVSAFFSLIIGTFFALLLTLSNIKHKTLITFMLLIPMLIPAQITAVSWLELVSPSGPLGELYRIFHIQSFSNPLYSKEGVILLLSIEHAALVFLTIRAGLMTIPNDIIEAARMSGATPKKIIFYIILPLIKPFLVAAFALAFVASIGNFGIPALLGIPGRYLVLSTLIYQRLSSFGSSVLENIGILSLILIIMAVLGLLVQYFVNSKNRVEIVNQNKMESPFKLNGILKYFIYFFSWTFLLFISILPLIALIKTSLIPAIGVDLSLKTLTFDNFIFAVSDDAASRAFINSTFLGVATSIIIAFVSFIFAYVSVIKKNRFANILYLFAEAPFVLPGIVLSIATIMAFIKPLPIINFSFYNTIWIILIAYLARFLAFGMKPVFASMYQFDKSLEEAAESVGANSFVRLKHIIMPQVLPSVIAGAILVFMSAFNELTVSSLLWSVENETLGVVIYNLYDEGNATGAAAVSVLTVIVTFIIIFILNLLSKKLPKGTLPWQM